MSSDGGQLPPAGRRRVVALTGGIGAGKSTVGELLGRLGAVVVDADALARAAIEPGSAGFAAVVAAFGDDLVGSKGSIDRAKLADLVFQDDLARRRLEQIVHPLVEQEAERQFERAPATATLIYELPLLAETGRSERFVGVIVVDAPDEVRLDRLVARGLSEADARRRIAAQASREQRLALADLVIDNSGSESELDARVRELFPRVAALG